MKATLNYLFFDILQGKNITENIKVNTSMHNGLPEAWFPRVSLGFLSKLLFLDFSLILDTFNGFLETLTLAISLLLDKSKDLFL